MAEELRRLQGAYERIVAVVGDGHVRGLTSLLKDEDVEVVRLWELRDPTARSARDGT
jgi:pheromone shutdown protein TraB